MSRRAIAGLLAGLALLAPACATPSSGQPTVPVGTTQPQLKPGMPGPETQINPGLPVTLQTEAGTHTEHDVLSGGPPAPYNYGPTVLVEQGRYQAWWCSQLPGVGPAGDEILYASSAQLHSGFGADFPGGRAPAEPVLTGNPGGFDGMHACDPSVIQAPADSGNRPANAEQGEHERYYLYYTGAAGDHAHGNAIGVASSSDGRVWRREHDSKPIVMPSGQVPRANDYGAGQPSVVHVDGWFYLMYTDTTASEAGWNGAGQFVLRARDAEFTQQVQTLTRAGFVPGRVSGKSVVDAFSADLMWIPTLEAFAIAHQDQQGTTLTFWDRDFLNHPYYPVGIPGPWQEGPGLVRTPRGHAPVASTDPCTPVGVDVLRATGLNTSLPAPAPSHIRSAGLRIKGAPGCS